MSAALLGTGDAVVGISHSGGNKEVIEALSLARNAGATVIAVTNYGKSPILRVSDIVLFTASKETAFKSDAVASRIAELAIIDALCAAVAFSQYEQSFENLKKTRQATVSRKY
jgi:DNA-binding MurR/RpiR family transcriptional regulator